jgi:hypothetical protein
MARSIQEKYAVRLYTVAGTREDPKRSKDGSLVIMESKVDGVVTRCTEGGYGQLKKLVGDYDPDMDTAEFAAANMDPLFAGFLPANCHFRVKRLGVCEERTEASSKLSQMGLTCGEVDEVATRKIHEERKRS